MAVLVEAISVLVKRQVIESRHPQGWEGFVAAVPNNTLCADEHLARVGFMTPADAERFVSALTEHGIVYLNEGRAQDICVADQQRGCLVSCDWVEIGHVSQGVDQSGRVTIARMIGDTQNRFAAPKGWSFEGSLSQTFGFVPSGEESKSLRFLRNEAGLDVYLNLVTGREVFIGRTRKRDA